MRFLIPVLTLIAALGPSPSQARPADFVGTYQILQSRMLALTNGRGFAIQDGSLVSESAIDRKRPSCRTSQSSFDDYAGQISVRFETAADGTEHALLLTIPSGISRKSTQIDCVSETGFTSALDISIALGRIVEVSR